MVLDEMSMFFCRGSRLRRRSPNVDRFHCLVVRQHGDDRVAATCVSNRGRSGWRPAPTSASAFAGRPIVDNHVVAARTRFAAIPAPICPSPMNPIRIRRIFVGSVRALLRMIERPLLPSNGTERRASTALGESLRIRIVVRRHSCASTSSGSMCPDLASDRYPKFIQQLTASPRFLAGENVHCDTAATTASSNDRPPSECLSRETRNGCPLCETSTRTTTTSLGKCFTMSPDSWGSTAWRSEAIRQHRRARTYAPPAALARQSAVVRPPAVSTTGDPPTLGPLVQEPAAEQSGRGASNLRAVFAGVRALAFAEGSPALRSSVEQPRWPADLQSGPHGPSWARRLPRRVRGAGRARHSRFLNSWCCGLPWFRLRWCRVPSQTPSGTPMAATAMISSRGKSHPLSRRLLRRYGGILGFSNCVRVPSPQLQRTEFRPLQALALVTTQLPARAFLPARSACADSDFAASATMAAERCGFGLSGFGLDRVGSQCRRFTRDEHMTSGAVNARLVSARPASTGSSDRVHRAPIGVERFSCRSSTRGREYCHPGGRRLRGTGGWDAEGRHWCEWLDAGARSPASTALISKRRSPTGMPTGTVRKGSVSRWSATAFAGAARRSAPRRLDNRAQPEVRLHGGALRHGQLSAAAFTEVSGGQRFGFALDATHESSHGHPLGGPAGSRQGACQSLPCLSEKTCATRGSRRRVGDKFGHLADATYRKLAPGFGVVVTILTGCPRTEERPGR